MTRRSHSLHPGAAIPMIVVRVALLAVMVGGLFVLVAPPIWFWIGVAAAVAAVLDPRTCMAWGVIVIIALGLMLGATEAWRTALALVVVTAIHQLGTLTQLLPLTASVQVGAFVPIVRSFVLVQVVAQPLALVLLLGWTEQSPDGSAWAAPAAAALLLLAVAGFAVLSRRPAGERPGRTGS